MDKGYWNPKRNMWINTHFSEINEHAKLQKKKALKQNNVSHAYRQFSFLTSDSPR